MLRGKNLTRWSWKSIGFQTLLRTKYVPSLVKIHWRMLILECSQGYYAVKIWPSDLDLENQEFQTLLRTKYVPSLVKIHCRMLILVFTRMLRGKNLTQWPWPWKSIGFQIPVRTKYVPSLVKIHWRMLILECSQGCYGRTVGSVTIFLHNFVGEGIINVFPRFVLVRIFFFALKSWK
jgi:hypothetical protein